MRRKIVIGVLVLGVAAMVAWFLTGQKAAGLTDLLQAPPGADQSAEAGIIHDTRGTEPATEAPKESASPATTTNAGISDSTKAMAETPESNHETYVAKRIVELQDLGMENDAASLDIILSELDNGDPSIRQAAVEAAVQFGSRDAVPRLMKAAAQADDAKEKSSILEAIEFLNMPSLTEALGQKSQSVPDASSSARPGR